MFGILGKLVNPVNVVPNPEPCGHLGIVTRYPNPTHHSNDLEGFCQRIQMDGYVPKKCVLWKPLAILAPHTDFSGKHLVNGCCLIQFWDLESMPEQKICRAFSLSQAP